ncbi:MAG: AcrR family transcriptional regulator [Halocynthiibacter sp.]|jgi:AcrR family transcriptional regulator
MVKTPQPKLTAPAKPRKSREDWLRAGFRALAKGGQSALRVEPIAREVGATKGSFYWHFEDLAALKSALWAYWSEAAVSGIIAQLEAQAAPGRARLERLLALATATPPEVGGRAAEPALRDWARYDPSFAAILAKVDQERIAYVARCFIEAGCADEMVKARLLYSALIGLEQQPSENNESSVEALNTLLEMMLKEADAVSKPA